MTNKYKYGDEPSDFSKTLIVIGGMIIPIIILFVSFFTVLRPFLKDQGPLIELAIVGVSAGGWIGLSGWIIEKQFGFKPFK